MARNPKHMDVTLTWCFKHICVGAFDLEGGLEEFFVVTRQQNEP